MTDLPPAKPHWLDEDGNPSSRVELLCIREKLLCTETKTDDEAEQVAECLRSLNAQLRTTP